jgi:hypothetical protein
MKRTSVEPICEHVEILSNASAYMRSIRNVCFSFILGGLLLTVLHFVNIGDTILRDDLLLLGTSIVSYNAPISTGCSLLDDSCLEKAARKFSRVWTYKPLEQWCSPIYISSTSTAASELRGLVLIKVPKAASSTSAAVALRIHDLHHCQVRWEHGRARDILFDNNYTSKSRRFLLAPIRAPESRALSAVYFHQISFHRKRTKNTPSENFILHHLRRTQPNFVTDYVQLNAKNSILSENTTESGVIEQHVRDILMGYDFLLVANRMDDSLVVLSLLANLPISSMLTMSSKIGGSWYFNGKNCIPLVSSTQAESISNFFQMDEWKAAHSADRLLFAAVEISLNRTIADLGNSFITRLYEFKRLQSIVQKLCRNETYFPCSGVGTPQLELSARHCYLRDFGCGYPCIDRIVLRGNEV